MRARLVGGLGAPVRLTPTHQKACQNNGLLRNGDRSQPEMIFVPIRIDF
jgi:hypothetical protein